jgi:hypothetical protein
MKTVKDESELPTPPATKSRTTQWFLRSKSDPAVLIEYHDGEKFRRRDGKAWMQPALERHARIDDNGEKHWGAFSPKNGYCDPAIYPYTETKVA